MQKKRSRLEEPCVCVYVCVSSARFEVAWNHAQNNEQMVFEVSASWTKKVSTLSSVLLLDSICICIGKLEICKNMLMSLICQMLGGSLSAVSNPIFATKYWYSFL